MHNFISISLTCSDQQEADKIATELLQEKLVACVKTMPIHSQFVWHEHVESSTEILLIMDSLEQHLPAIEKTVSTVHSYNTFVLTATAMLYVSQRAQDWIIESCSQSSDNL
jgi:periplasmic divalent cation tolerance protein